MQEKTDATWVTPNLQLKPRITNISNITRNKNLKKIERPIFTGIPIELSRGGVEHMRGGSKCQCHANLVLFPHSVVNALIHQISRTGCGYRRITCSAESCPKGHWPMEGWSRVLRTTLGEASPRATMPKLMARTWATHQNLKHKTRITNISNITLNKSLQNKNIPSLIRQQHPNCLVLGWCRTHVKREQVSVPILCASRPQWSMQRSTRLQEPGADTHESRVPANHA